MGFYTDKSDKTFFPVVYVREDGVLERQLELLRQAGWKIIEFSCEKLLESSGSAEAAVMVFEDLHWLDLSQGFFFVLKNYDALFQSPHDPQYYMAEWAAELLQSVDGDLRFYRTWNEDGEYDPTPVLYAMDVSRDTLDTVLEFLRVGRLWCLILMKRILGRSILCM